MGERKDRYLRQLLIADIEEEAGREPSPRVAISARIRIEAAGGVILDATDAEVETTLIELADMLRDEYGVSFARSTIWRFSVGEGSP